MAKDNLTKEANISVTARELDFVTRFSQNWEALLTITGISRPIKKDMGAVLKVKKGAIVLQSGEVPEGNEIPYSLASVTEEVLEEMDIEKWAKAVSAEAIKTYGYDVAVAKTDDAFLNQLQRTVMDRFYGFLKTGTLTNIQPSFQMALAMAKGYVVNMFQSLNLTCTDVIGFVNTLDVYEYLANANITVQTEFGFNYIKNFMGYNTIFLLPDEQIPRNKVIACPVENIIMYYVDPSDSDFAKAGLQYTVDGVTPLLGFHTQGNYGTAVSESFAIMGLRLMAEYLDGIAVVSIDSTGSLGAVTVASAAGAETGDSKITVTFADKTPDMTLFYKGASSDPTPAYKATIDSTWTALAEGENNIAGLTSGNVVSVVAVNGTGQVLAAGHATVVVKS